MIHPNTNTELERHIILPEAEAKRIHKDLVDNGWDDACVIPVYLVPQPK